jgi:transposase
VSVSDREGLIARIRHLRRQAAVSDTPAAETHPGDPFALGALETRIAHLEQLVEGLQDSVHRESLRQEDRIGALEAQIQPAALSAALSKDVRERGL